MCGLFGYIGKNSADPNKIKLLWIYSSTRGRDSTGLYRKNKIFKRAYKFSTGVSGNSFEIIYGSILKPTVNENHTILGHCRAKTIGAISEDNTHPFEYNIDNNRWIFAHNGTIRNIVELATKYNVERKPDITDSQTFGELIVRTNFEVLNEYRGTAAFSLYNETEDTLYLWRGFSDHANTGSEEERPLYIHKRGSSIYWASEALNLVTAHNTAKGVSELDFNCLYIIQGGKIIDRVYKDRSAVQGWEPVATTTHERSHGNNIFRKNKKQHSKNVVSAKSIEINPQNKAKGNVYYYKGLYYRQGHLLTGDCWINDDGKMCFTQKEIELTNAKPYYFIKGIMLKDAATYEKLKNTTFDYNYVVQNSYEVMKKDLHPEFLLIKGFELPTQWVFLNTEFKFNCRVTPKWGYYTYVLNNSGSIESIVKIEAENEKQEKNHNKNHWENAFTS